jgi:hypothetical protein
MINFSTSLVLRAWMGASFHLLFPSHLFLLCYSSVLLNCINVFYNSFLVAGGAVEQTLSGSAVSWVGVDSVILLLFSTIIIIILLKVQLNKHFRKMLIKALKA